MSRQAVAFLAIVLSYALTLASYPDEDRHGKLLIRIAINHTQESKLQKHCNDDTYKRENDDGIKNEKKEEKKDKDEDEKRDDYKHKHGKTKNTKKKSYHAKCMFKFCDGRRLKYVGKNSKALTPAICSKNRGEKIGGVDRTGEAYLVKHKLICSSKWKLNGLKQSFAPSFFKAYTKKGKNVSGIGHEVAQVLEQEMPGIAADDLSGMGQEKQWMGRKA